MCEPSQELYINEGIKLTHVLENILEQ